MYNKLILSLCKRRWVLLRIGNWHLLRVPVVAADAIASPHISDASGNTSPTFQPTAEIWWLLLSVGLFCFSMWLIHQSADLQEKAAKGQPNSPDPASGVNFAWLLSLLIVSGSLLYWSDSIGIHTANSAVAIMQFFRGILEHPKLFSNGFLLASALASGVACFKFGLLVPYPTVHRQDEARSPLLKSIPGVVTSIVILLFAIFALTKTTMLWPGQPHW